MSGAAARAACAAGPVAAAQGRARGGAPTRSARRGRRGALGGGWLAAAEPRRARSRGGARLAAGAGRPIARAEAEPLAAAPSHSLPSFRPSCLPSTQSHSIPPFSILSREQDPKFVYYLSAEFLQGRSLLNAVLNLGLEGEYAEVGAGGGLRAARVRAARQAAAVGRYFCWARAAALAARHGMPGAERARVARHCIARRRP